MNTRFYHARILPMSEGIRILEGELWVEGNRITCVGTPDKPAPQWDREIDCGGDLLLPGFKNAHTHSPMTFLRSFADDLPLQEWLSTQVFPMEAQLEGDDVYQLTKLAILEYLTSGVTSFFDMYKDPDQVARAAADCGFRAVLCGHVNDFAGDAAYLEDAFLRLNQYSELVGYRLGFHAEYTCSTGLLEQISALAHKYRAPVFTHNSETKREVQECIARHGKTPTAFLDGLGLFDFGGGGYHCVHVTGEDLEIFQRRGLSAVTNPGSNCKLASGIAPLGKMREMGLMLAIGTDGPASNNCLDMFREMFLVTALQKLREENAAAMDAGAVLQMATAGGAKTLGLPDCDVLAPGKLADLIRIDLHQPNMQPLNHIANNLVYSGSKQNVRLTMVNGRILYEDGRFDIGAAPEEIYARANEIIGRMR